MTTKDTDVTEDWVDIKTSLTLTLGSKYIVDHAVGGKVYIREGATSPSSRIGHPLETGESRAVTITSEKLWVRTDSASAKIVLTVEA